MKVPFTFFQLFLTLINTFMYFLCIAADAFMLLFDRGTVNGRTLIINLVLSVIAVTVSLILIIKAGSINIFGGKVSEEEDTEPSVRALRTYFCMLSFDFAGVLAIMLAGALVYKSAVKAIMIFAPSVFIFAGIVYFVRVSRIGLSDFSDDDGGFYDE